jgi:polysaccharide deacetylase family protein (PEP-CTERM system associated)
MTSNLMITIDVEEWHHSEWFNADKILKRQPTNVSSSCEENVISLLKLFEELSVNATFFILGEIAERYPKLIKKITEQGHEVACHGYIHKSIHELGEQAFKIQAEKTRGIIKKISGKEPLGYRAANFQITTQAINILEELGFRYDSSIVPCLNLPGWYNHPFAPLTPYKPSRQDMCKEDSDRDFFEIPIAVLPLLRLPGGGGWFLRNFGYQWTKTVLKALSKKAPVTLYIHPWEVCENNPKLRGIPPHVFRRTGRYVKDAIRDLVRDSGVKPITIQEYLNDNGWSV